MLDGDAEDVFMQDEMEDEEAIVQNKPKKTTSGRPNIASQRKASLPNNVNMAGKVGNNAFKSQAIENSSNNFSTGNGKKSHQNQFNKGVTAN